MARGGGGWCAPTGRPRSPGRRSVTCASRSASRAQHSPTELGKHGGTDKLRPSIKNYPAPPASRIIRSLGTKDYPAPSARWGSDHMRRIIVAAAATTLIGAVVAACGTTSSSGGGSGSSPPATAASCSNASIQKDLYTKGVLTVATDNPVFTPWFVKNKPSNGQGY